MLCRLRGTPRRLRWPCVPCWSRGLAGLLTTLLFLCCSVLCCRWPFLLSLLPGRETAIANSTEVQARSSPNNCGPVDWLRHYSLCGTEQIGQSLRCERLLARRQTMQSLMLGIRVKTSMVQWIDEHESWLTITCPWFMYPLSATQQSTGRWLLHHNSTHDAVPCNLLIMSETCLPGHTSVSTTSSQR